MSHLADALAAERVCYTTPYYHQNAWPHFFERSSAPIPQYPLPTNASSFTGTANWDNASSSSIVTSASSGTDNSNFPTRQSHSQTYNPLPNPYASENHPQQAEAIQELSYPQLYSVEDDQNRSPSSISEYTVWDSPKSPVDHNGFDHGREAEPGRPSLLAAGSEAPVKVEDHDDCFIMELSSAEMFEAAGKMGGGMRVRAGGVSAAHSLSISQSLAPPTEVPLRATQASDDMRARMGVFRLNPFTMHSLSVNADDNMAVQDDVDWEATQPPWCGGEPHALEEEPLLYEFQLDLYDAVTDVQESRRDGRGAADHMSCSGSDARSSDTLGVVGSNEASQLHSFSPDFELHPMDEDISVATSRKNASSCSQDIPPDRNRDHVGPTNDTDYASHSELDSSSATTTRPAHTPFIESPRTIASSFDQEQQQQRRSSPLRSSVWDAVNEQYCPSNFSVGLLPMGSKISMHMESGAKRLSGLHVASPRPYMHRSFQYQHTNEPPTQGPYGVPQLHPRLPLLSQPTHHALHQSYASHQPPYLSSEPSYRPQSYHENSPTQSKAMTGPRRAVTQSADVLPAYMRDVRGPRSRGDDYRQEGSMYDHQLGNQTESETKGYTSSLEHVSQSTPAAVMAHYMSHIDGAASGNRRWSLPETATGHSQGGQFLS